MLSYSYLHSCCLACLKLTATSCTGSWPVTRCWPTGFCFSHGLKVWPCTAVKTGFEPKSVRVKKKKKLRRFSQSVKYMNYLVRSFIVMGGDAQRWWYSWYSVFVLFSSFASTKREIILDKLCFLTCLFFVFFPEIWQHCPQWCFGISGAGHRLSDPRCKTVKMRHKLSTNRHQIQKGGTKVYKEMQNRQTNYYWVF